MDGREGVGVIWGWVGERSLGKSKTENVTPDSMNDKLRRSDLTLSDKLRRQTRRSDRERQTRRSGSERQT